MRLRRRCRRIARCSGRARARGIMYYVRTAPPAQHKNDRFSLCNLRARASSARVWLDRKYCVLYYVQTHTDTHTLVYDRSERVCPLKLRAKNACAVRARSPDIFLLSVQSVFRARGTRSCDTVLHGTANGTAVVCARFLCSWCACSVCV